MNEQDFQQRLGELITQINNLPESQRGPLEQLASETRERHDQMKKTVADLQESLDYLRLSIKYLVFDLEATRRENEFLRKLIDSQSQGPGPEGEADPE
jgi:chromosome segregation ATPase